MSPVSGVGGASTPPAPVIKPPAAQAVQPEARETAQTERTEAQRGAQETGEAQAPPANPSVGTRLNVTA